MKHKCIAACIAASMLGACASPDIASRLDSNPTLNTGFEAAEAYTPEPVGARAANDMMRFSTMSIAR